MRGLVSSKTFHDAKVTQPETFHDAQIVTSKTIHDMHIVLSETDLDIQILSQDLWHGLYLVSSETISCRLSAAEEKPYSWNQVNQRILTALGCLLNNDLEIIWKEAEVV